MDEAAFERAMLLLLSALISRQRLLAKGQSSLVFAALHSPPTFDFERADGYLSCYFDLSQEPLFLASLLVCEDRNFVSPVAGLRFAMKLVRDGRRVEARIPDQVLPPGSTPSTPKRAPILERWLVGSLRNLTQVEQRNACAAFWSPLQVLFNAEIGFFLPTRMQWHEYVADYLCSRLPGSNANRQGSHTKVKSNIGEFDIGESGAGLSLEYRGTSISCSFAVGENGFSLMFSGDPGHALTKALSRWHAVREWPTDVTVETADSSGQAFRIVGGPAC